jgi:hypothetical protein
MKRFLFFVGVAWLVPGVAFADPSDGDRATARALAHEGFEAQQRSDYEVAADRFTRADALVHAPTLLLGLARAQVGLRRLVEAQETYQRIVREPLAPHAPAVFAKALEDAKRELSDLAPRLASVTIRIEGGASPAVTLDEIPVPPAALGVRRLCDPGVHVVKGSAAGFDEAKVTFTIVEGGEQDVTLSMKPLPSEPTPSVAATPQPGFFAPLQVKLAMASFGLGAAGLITGSVTGALVLAKHSSLNGGPCSDGKCPASEGGEVSAYRTLANVSTAAFVVAGVGAALGVTLLFTEPKTKTVGVFVGPTSAGVIGTF